MHVVMLTNTVAPDKTGGLERYVRELSGALVRAGVEVTVVAKRIRGEFPPRQIGADGVRLIRYPVPDKRDPTFALRYPVSVTRAVNRALATAGPDALLHGHFAVPAFAPALRRMSYMYTCHAPVHRELLSERQGSYFLPRPVQAGAVAGLRLAERAVLRRAGAVIVLSSFVRREVAALDPAVAAMTHLVPGGLDADRFSPAPPGTDPLDGLPEADRAWAAQARPLLVVVRRLVPRTGVPDLVRALPAVLRSIPGARLAVIGEGPLHGQVQAEISRLNLAAAVRLCGRVSDTALVAWYRAAGLAVTPTQELEGFGLATAEAMACGTPALVTPVGANPEVAGLLSGELITADRSPLAIGTALRRVLGSSGELAGLARLARGRVLHLGWDRVAQAHLELYQSRLGRTGAQPPGRYRTGATGPDRYRQPGTTQPGTTQPASAHPATAGPGATLPGPRTATESTGGPARSGSPGPTSAPASDRPRP
jgi:glycosyltransferase involved in cell wall biosynthesis